VPNEQGTSTTFLHVQNCPSLQGGAALPVGPGAFPYAPEFCAFLIANADSLGFSFAITPAMLPDLGLTLSQPAATAFLGAVAGASTST
jgi:hypothetical protein